MVFDRDVELSTPAADHDQLARLAALTKEFGGRVVAPEQVPACWRTSAIGRRRWKSKCRPSGSWPTRRRDAWSLLLLFVVLLTGEWFLRKKWGLV